MEKELDQMEAQMEITIKDYERVLKEYAEKPYTGAVIYRGDNDITTAAIIVGKFSGGILLREITEHTDEGLFTGNHELLDADYLATCTIAIERVRAKLIAAVMNYTLNEWMEANSYVASAKEEIGRKEKELHAVVVDFEALGEVISKINAMPASVKNYLDALLAGGYIVPAIKIIRGIADLGLMDAKRTAEHFLASVHRQEGAPLKELLLNMVAELDIYEKEMLALFGQRYGVGKDEITFSELVYRQI